MRRSSAGLAGLVVLIALLTACGETGSSVKSAASSIAASHSVSVTQSAGTPTPTPTQAETSAAASSPAATQSEGGGAGPSTGVTHSQGTGVVPAPAVTAPAAGSGSGFPWTLFWVLLAIAVVAGLSIWAIVARHRRRASAASSWHTRVVDAYARGAALHDAMAAAETPGALAAEDAGLRWSDIQRRADDYGQLLYGMRQAAPGDQERIVISDVIASLQAARSAMDAERSAGKPDGMLSGIVRDRISFFASSLSSLREPDVRPA